MLFDRIDVALLNKPEFNVNTYKDSVAKEIEATGLLLSGYFSLYDYTAKGVFNDKIWIFKNKLSQTYNYFVYNNLDELIFKGVTEQDIILTKCWIATSILNAQYEKDNNIEYGRIETMQQSYNILVKFLAESSNFSEEYINDKKGSKLKDFFNRKNAKRYYKTITEYIDYLEDKVSEEKLLTLSTYRMLIDDIASVPNKEYTIRELPQSKDILLFSYYINKFFYQDDHNELLKLYFMPVLLWWKITNIIPMRASEFAIALKRNCLEVEDGVYYLKINRIKEKSNKKKKYLPLLKRVAITKDLYDLISDYINKTDKYKKGKTLISYVALHELRNQLCGSLPQFKVKHEDISGTHKRNPEYFTNVILIKLIEDFYRIIIKDIYNDNLIQKRILPGDTRHFAFTSLMLQGYSPVEIAILGGHRTLDALDNYTCSTNTYIDTEVMTLIRNNIQINSINTNKLINIITKMPNECPSQNPIPAYIGDTELGYCTAVFTNGSSPCESMDCYKCSKWWCEPNEYNYMQLEDIVKNKINQENNKLQRDIDFILSLLKKLGLDVKDGHLEANHKITQEIKKMSLQLNSRTKGIIQMKAELTPDDEKAIMSIDELNYPDIDKYLK